MSPATVEATKLTDRIHRIEPSATMAAAAEADKLRSQGVDLNQAGRDLSALLGANYVNRDRAPS